jgi:putative aminopeptidase FrvX
MRRSLVVKAFEKHLSLLKELIFTPGVSGWEDPVREKIIEKVSRYGETAVDPLGNLMLTFGRGDKHALFVAHMDEIGLVVSHIEDNGFIRVRKVGGLDDRVLAGRTVDIYPDGAPEPVPGVIGLKPPHLMKDRAKEMAEVIKSEDTLIDVGTTSRKETAALGITKLSPIILRKHFSVLANDLIASRGFDDRMGCAALVEALEIIAGEDLGLKITFAWSVQEELGLRGAYALGNELRPDFAIAIDSCTTGDSPHVDFHLSAVRLHEGPILRMFDRMAFASRSLMKSIADAAEKEAIPIQVAVTGGATDGAAIQTFGVAMIPLSVPIRYVHSPTEVMSLRDYDNLVKLLALVARNLRQWA